MGDFDGEEVEIIFNRDILISEGEVIDNVNKSQDLSLESRLAQHPWVKDVQDEMDRIKKEHKENMEQFDPSFNPIVNDKETEEDISD